MNTSTHEDYRDWAYSPTCEGMYVSPDIAAFLNSKDSAMPTCFFMSYEMVKRWIAGNYGDFDLLKQLKDLCLEQKIIVIQEPRYAAFRFQWGAGTKMPPLLQKFMDQEKN